MALYEEFYFPSSDGENSIHVNLWLPDGDVKAVLQILHGVAEYGLRYKDFAEFLCGMGFAVCANDHLGHGKSVKEGGTRLYFGEKDGWKNVVDDVEKLRKLMRERFPDVPYFLFGHSMGSFIARTYLIRYPGNLSGAVICGTGFPPKIVISSGKIVSGIKIKSLGKKGFSPFVDDIAFGGYNKKFKPNRTPSDWLSVNCKNVDDYIKDPLCGGKTTLGLFRDMLDGLSIITDRKNIEKMDKDLPVFIISGECDPVGDMGKGVKKTFDEFKRAGMKNVSMKLYPSLRHEILNEEERDIVYKDVLSFLTENI